MSNFLWHVFRERQNGDESPWVFVADVKAASAEAAVEEIITSVGHVNGRYYACKDVSMVPVDVSVEQVVKIERVAGGDE